MSTPAPPVTAEELFDYADARRYELVRGVPRVSEPPGGVHGRLAMKLGGRLDEHVTRLGLGTVLVEAGYVLEREPDTVRGPDISFVSTTRLPPIGSPSSSSPGRRISRWRSSLLETAGPKSRKKWQTISPAALDGYGWWIRGNDG